MDRPEADDREGRPLTRRELRAAAAAVPDDGSAPAEADGQGPDEATEEEVAAGPAAQLDPAAGSDAPTQLMPTQSRPQPAEPWDAAVRWSLRQELPRQLPPEPEIDDVRWEPAGVPSQPVARFVPTRLATPPADRAPRPGEPVKVRTDPPTAAAPGAPTQGDGDRTTEPAEGPVGPPRPIGALPTLTDLLAARPAPPAGPAEQGWQGAIRRLTRGLVAPPPGSAEQRRRRAVATTQRSLDGPRTIVVINPKGGAHKTTATMLIAATFGLQRGGYTLAWDNNETRGTLGWRSRASGHHNTAVNLLQDLDRFSDPGSTRVGDLDNYVRSQGAAQFDVLASDEDAASAASIDAFAFRSLHRTLSRFYRIMVIDTGNNMRASNWQAAIEAADQVVLVSTVREDTAQSAAWAVDALRATGHEELVRKAVTVLSAPAASHDDRLADRLHEHFGRLTREVVDVPYDDSLVSGQPIRFEALSRATREAWLRVTAAVAEGL